MLQGIKYILIKLKLIQPSERDIQIWILTERVKRIEHVLYQLASEMSLK